MSALIIGARQTRIALSIARGLGIRGINVYTADPLKLVRAGFSRFNSRHFTYTPLTVDPNRFVADIKKIVRDRGIKVLFPVHDDEYYFITKNNTLFDRIGTIPLPHFSLIEQVKDKDKLIDISKNSSAIIPDSILIDSPTKLYESIDRLGYPLVVKPLDKDSGKDIFFLENKRDLSRLSAKLEEIMIRKFFILQKYIEGTTYGIGLIYQRGTLVSSITYEQIHHLPVFGGCPTITQVSNLQGLEIIMDEILSKAVWHGLCQADFIVEHDTGNVYLLDINPRPFGAIFQTIHSGLNFPYILYKMALEEDFKIDSTVTNMDKLLWLEGEIYRFIDCFKGAWPIKNPDIYSSLTNIGAIEDFAFRDIKPFIYSPLCLAIKHCNNYFAKLALSH